MARARKTPPSLSQQLRAALRRGALTGRELAALAGVSQPTVSGLEHGRDVGHGTLQQLIDVLPGLDPRSILGRPAVGPRPSTRRLWRYFADLWGFRAREVALRVRVDAAGGQASELEVTGLACDRGTLHDASRRAGLMGAVLVGTPEAVFGLREAPAISDERTLTVEDGDVLHVFELPEDLDREGIRYLRRETGEPRPAGADMPGQAPHGRPFEHGVALWLDYAAERLVFRVEFDEGCRPEAVRPEAWPASIGIDPTHPLNVFAALCPHGPRWIATTRGGVAELRIDHPLPGPCYGLSWGHDRVSGTPARSPASCRLGKPPPIQEVLARARRRAGFSGRALARRLDVSPATLAALERDSEPRASTLRTYVEALDDLSPFELLRPFESSEDVTRDEAWAFQRDLFGMEAMEEVTLIRISELGNMQGDLKTDGLSWTPTAAQDVRLRHGLNRVPRGATWELESITTEEEDEADEPKVKVLRRGDGPVVHELRFPSGERKRRLSFTRSITGRGQFALTRDRARQPEYSGRTWEAVYAEPSIPARRLRFELTFPKGYWPLRVNVKVVARSMLVTQDVEDLQARVHPTGFDLRADAAASTVRIQVTKPLVGLRYLVVWPIS